MKSFTPEVLYIVCCVITKDIQVLRAPKAMIIAYGARGTDHSLRRARDWA